MNAQLIPEEVAVLARSHIGIISQRSALWDGVIGDLIVKGPTGNHEVVVTPAVDTFFLTRSNDPHPLTKRLNNGPSRSAVHPGSIVNFVAAGDRLITQVQRGNGGMERLALSIMPQVLKGLADSSELKSFQLRSALLIERSLPQELLKTLVEEITLPGVHGRLYAETLVVALIIDLIRHNGTPSRIAPVKGGLAPLQLRRVMEMIHDRLVEDISLAELAQVTDLSKSHFVRAFRRSTGLPPHKYQLNARVERAKHLLRRGDMTLTEIGLDCGFTDQSQFIRAFRRSVGLSPGAWQRLQRI
jgi:AraC-like DNA-binding protein